MDYYEARRRSTNTWRRMDTSCRSCSPTWLFWPALLLATRLTLVQALITTSNRTLRILVSTRLRMTMKGSSEPTLVSNQATNYTIARVEARLPTMCQRELLIG